MDGRSSRRPEQLVLDIPHRPALGAEDFLVSACNAAAVRLVDGWPDWPDPVYVLTGGRGCGKSHLAHVWRLRSGARPLDAGALARTGDGAPPARAAVLLEDMDRAAVPDEALFHFLNICREEGVTALLTASAPPARWPARLPDLVSRLRSLPVVEIGAPDDALLRAVLLKQFHDRQIDVAPRAIEYLLARMDRSMAMARDLVEALDRAALAAGRPVTRALARSVLEGLATPESTGPEAS